MGLYIVHLYREKEMIKSILGMGWYGNEVALTIGLLKYNASGFLAQELLTTI